MPSKKSTPPRKRPSLPHASDEMKRWSSLLSTELQRWPGVRLGKMFGLVSVYRGDEIFALLPATRGFETANGLAIKHHDAPLPDGSKWQRVEITEDRQLGSILEQLDAAYRSLG